MKNTAYNSDTIRGAAALQRSRAYASPGDFCTIFRDDMNSLYSLALVLTSSHELADKAFLAALDDCRTGNSVFSEWARSWSRRAVIKSAIRLLDPIRPGRGDVPAANMEAIASEMDPSGHACLRLETFERFVFVISVLEGYAVRECATLLGAIPREVEQARVQALQKIAGNKQNILPVSHDNTQRAANSIFTLH